MLVKNLFLHFFKSMVVYGLVMLFCTLSTLPNDVSFIYMLVCPMLIAYSLVQVGCSPKLSSFNYRQKSQFGYSFS